MRYIVQSWTHVTYIRIYMHSYIHTQYKHTYIHTYIHTYNITKWQLLNAINDMWVPNKARYKLLRIILIIFIRANVSPFQATALYKNRWYIKTHQKNGTLSWHTKHIIERLHGINIGLWKKGHRRNVIMVNQTAYWATARYKSWPLLV